ncbi:uncharacterized protein MYCGRDRAFT_105511 [Zymoseptoria tritici IPO323]|uniref:Uncharacterized protein n=1 Tax=Zymoseptoria tritici (strain CBS 115943 / IPO323) TaxID=336722 RepID=F9XI79_ZYMTI|nr:uncharacterized protein MYCGRDRAFT_105511 [Zymoseptoria tritici IPO323]EGP85310.1 hypothetical protein MYCGRDRAFT_105511 [Zymoseptoria tritici IPO323]
MNRSLRAALPARATVLGKWRPRHSRFYAQQAPPSQPATAASKVTRIESRLPKFLRRYTEPLRNAPVSHITAFLLLHELTAVVPLFGLAGIFHWSGWMPPFVSEWKWVAVWTEKFGNWLRKKNWFKDGKGDRWYGKGEQVTRLAVELATAYAITKALLPLRLMLSVWATPWFARWTVLPVTNWLSRIVKRKGNVAAKGSATAGTGATAGGVLPKDVK